MSYRNEKFNQSMKSLEETMENLDISKLRTVSDRGNGVRCMVEQLDYDPAAKVSEKSRDEIRAEQLLNAELRLLDANRKFLIPTLRLIVQNGSNREESLWHMERRTYFEHRQQLLDFFCYRERQFQNPMGK